MKKLILSLMILASAALSADLPILAEIDQFALVKKLGEGAAGKVYKAIDRETGVEVAVKGLPVSVSETKKACIKANFQIVTKLKLMKRHISHL